MPTYRTRNGRVQAIVRIKRDGAIIHQESRTFASKRLAQQWGEKLEAKLLLDGVPQRRVSQKTFGAYLLEYLEHLEEHSELRRTRTAEIVQLAGHPKIGNRRLSDLDAKVFSEFATHRRAEGAGPTTVLHNLSTLRSALNSARPVFGFELDSTAVTEAIAALKRTGVVSPSHHRDRRPTPGELKRLFAELDRIAAHPQTEIPTRKIVELAIAFPRRLGELCSLLWDDYDRKRSLFKLRDTKHSEKMSRRRDEVIPVPPAAREVIDTLPVVDARVLPFVAESVSASFERARDRLGIVDLRFHDFRHEGISRLFEAGYAIQEVALISGHTSWAMLRRYTHLSADALVEKMNARQQEAPQADPEPEGS